MDENEKRKELAVYLQDHYAGAVAAIEMLEHLIKTHAGKPLERFFRKPCADIRSDRRQLRNVMTVLGFQESTVRDTGAWMAEKLARTKLGFSNGKTVGLRLVESLEILQLGISGKRALWRVLSAVSKNSRLLQHTDFTVLERRALEQLERVDAKRLEAARATFRAT
jgi:hypothetical protein